jgi:hypothetical protein
MKKLVLFISCAALSLSLTAQSLQFVNINPVSTTLSGPNDVMMQSHLQVKNIGPVTLTVKVKRTVNNLATNHVSNFCFAGVCYPSAVSTSLAWNIDPGAVADSEHVTLRADLNPLSTNGISEVTYCAYDADNESDSICITFRYNAGPIGVNELSGGSKFMSNAYPNPAHQTSLVTYSLPSMKNAQIVISNMLGSAINKLHLSEKSGTVELPVAALPEGVYYYTLMNDGKPVVSKRLMISHN